MERRFFLERFLRNLAKYDFIIQSPEFQLFCRPQGPDVAKSLEKMPKMTPDQLYERVKEATGIDDANYDDKQKEQYDRTITEFAFFAKKAEPFLKQLKNDLSNFLNNKSKVMKGYMAMAKLLNDYEELNLTQYSDIDVNRLILNHPQNSELKAAMVHTVENQ